MVPYLGEWVSELTFCLKESWGIRIQESVAECWYGRCDGRISSRL